MLRQAELFRVVGRRLSERLIAAKLIEPVRVGSGIFFDAYKLHRALGRIQRLDGHHVRNPSLSEALEVRTRLLEELFENLSLDDLSDAKRPRALFRVRT